MKEWKVSEAKAHFSEVVANGKEAPQSILHRNKPVAALISIDDFEQFKTWKSQSSVPSMSELLEELQAINAEEGDLEIPERGDREVPDIEAESE